MSEVISRVCVSVVTFGSSIAAAVRFSVMIVAATMMAVASSSSLSSVILATSSAICSFEDD